MCLSVLCCKRRTVVKRRMGAHTGTPLQFDIRVSFLTEIGIGLANSQIGLHCSYIFSCWAFHPLSVSRGRLSKLSSVSLIQLSGNAVDNHTGNAINESSYFCII